MKNFKKSLTAFAAILTLASMSSSVYALSTSDMISKTDNINSPSGNASNFQIDMSSTAGKGAVGQIDWKNYSVPAGQTVRYGFSNLNQTILNRVLGGQASSISGKITSGCSAGVSCGDAALTGKVLLINPAGVVFRDGSAVDLNSFTVSTKDVSGAKNLKDVTNMNDYQNTLNGLSKNVTFVNGNSNGTVWLYGTTINADKSIGVVSDNIVYKNSLLKTNGSNSNIKLISADGVTFTYEDNGKIASSTSKTGAGVKTLYINNSEKFKGSTGSEGIYSSNIELNSDSTNADSYVYAKDATIKGTKLATTDNGDILITSQNKVILQNAQLQADGSIKGYGAADFKVAGSSNINAAKDVELSSKYTYITDSSITGKDITAKGNDVTIANGSKITGNNSVNTTASNQLFIHKSEVNGQNSLTAKSTNGKVYVAGSTLNSKNGNIDVKADNSNVQLYDNTTLNAGNIASVSGKVAYVRNSNVNGKNIDVNASDKAYVYDNAKLTASENAQVYGKNVAYTKNATISGTKLASVKSDSSAQVLDNTNLTSANNIDVISKATYVKNAKLTSDGTANVRGEDGFAYVYDSSNIKAGTTANVTGVNVNIKTATVDGKDVNVAGGNVTISTNSKISATNNVSASSSGQLYIHKSEVNGQNGITAKSTNSNLYIAGSTLNSKNGNIDVSANTSNVQLYDNTKLDAGKTASVKGTTTYIRNASINGKNINVNGFGNTYVYDNAKLTASENVEVYGKNVAYTKNAEINGTKLVSVKSDSSAQVLDNTNLTSANKINVESANTYVKKAKLTTDGTVDVNGKTGLAYVYDSSSIKAGTTANVKGGTVYVRNASVDAKDVNVNGNNIAYVYDSSKIKAGASANVKGGTVYVKNSTVEGKDININGNGKTYVYDNAKLNGTNSLTVKSNSDIAYVKDATLKATNGDVTVDGGTKTYVYDSTVTSSGKTTLTSKSGVYASNATIKGKKRTVNGTKTVTY